MSEFDLNIKLSTEIGKIVVPCNSTTTAEDVCIFICNELQICPLTRHLFALRFEKSVYLPPMATIVNEKDSHLDFRIRYKVPNVLKLENIDPNTYNYYFHQARLDVLENKVPGLVYEKYKSDLLGLGITDMHRYILEKESTVEAVEKDYKKFIPREVSKRHPFFIKTPIHNNLVRLQKTVRNVKYVKSEYIKQLELIGPEYLSEEYKAYLDKEGHSCLIIIKVSPNRNEGVKYCYESKKEQWNDMCLIDEISSISIKGNTVEMYTNAIPINLRFYAVSIMFSFISLLDGYYRLSCKWTFNICSEVFTPSLERLKAMKCHGPVGSKFAYAKLAEKRGNKHGTFIIRESEKTYNIYYVDVCMRNRKPSSFKLQRISTNELVFHDDPTKYKSVDELIKAYKDPNGVIYLNECLRASESDVSPLLLCKTDEIAGSSSVVSGAIDEISSAPLCINYRDIQKLEGYKTGFRGRTAVFRARWKFTEGKVLEVAMKTLNQEGDRYFKEFWSLAGKWAFLKSSTIVRFYGLALEKNMSFILEYLPFGSLDKYLREKKGILKPEDLIEASSNLAYALWHLSKNNIVHGKIRCRKLLVYEHSDNRFAVKLADPGIHTPYDLSEIHWIPVECYSASICNFESAKESSAADVWAFATTVWEIFSYGETLKSHIGSKEFYKKGERLPRPPACQEAIYKIMLKCWDADPDTRLQPQEVKRDVSQFLYAVYDSRKTHSYARPSNISIDTTSIASDQRTETTDISEIWDRMDDFKLKNETILELDESNVIPHGMIGHGFYGDVYKADYYYDTGLSPIPVAVKKLKDATTSSVLDFEREINIMKQLDHENIVKVLGVLREKDGPGEQISLVMEYIQHGSLRNHLQTHKDFIKHDQLIKYAYDIAKGMEYLGSETIAHRNFGEKIVHRDLAARNILVVNDYHVKITDFGLARVIRGSDYYMLKTVRNLPIKWYAPESLAMGKFSVKTDVWSYGVTMCEIFGMGNEPRLENAPDAQTQEEFLKALEEGDRFPRPPKCSPAIYNKIIWPCWNFDSHLRPSFSELISKTHDLLSDL